MKEAYFRRIEQGGQSVLTFSRKGWLLFARWQGGVRRRGTRLAAQVWQGTKRESKETQRAVAILGKMVRGLPVTEAEKQFFRAQSTDLARLLPLVALQGIPLPIPFVPLLILLGKKYGVQFLPGDQSALVAAIEAEKEAQQALALVPSAEELAAMTDELEAPEAYGEEGAEAGAQPDPDQRPRQ